MRLTSRDENNMKGSGLSKKQLKSTKGAISGTAIDIDSIWTTFSQLSGWSHNVLSRGPSKFSYTKRPVNRMAALVARKPGDHTSNAASEVCMTVTHIHKARGQLKASHSTMIHSDCD